MYPDQNSHVYCLDSRVALMAENWGMALGRRGHKYLREGGLDWSRRLWISGTTNKVLRCLCQFHDKLSFFSLLYLIFFPGCKKKPQWKSKITNDSSINTNNLVEAFYSVAGLSAPLRFQRLAFLKFNKVALLVRTPNFEQ